MKVNRLFCLLLFFNIERVFAILFSYLKEPQLITANLTPGSITSRILDTEAREGRLQKEREMQSHACIQCALISSQLQLLDPNYWVGEDRRWWLSTPPACGNRCFPFFLLNAPIEVLFFFPNSMTL